jgi:pimeloyl-ACP methyl ester carboxylesterase
MNSRIDLSDTGRAVSTARPLTPGRVQRRRVAGDRRLSYFIYVPRKCTEGAPVLVAVHGISHNAREQARAFAPLAERCGFVLVAPLFRKSAFPRYQQLGIASGSIFPRADLALERMLQEVAELTGARTQRFHLFGFSGGGQFAHRYAMAHPERVLAVALGAPGWYTYPDPAEPYPFGTASRSASGLLTFCRESYLRVPMAVFVGQDDDARDLSLKQSPRLDRRQGTTRLKRGRRWIEAMRTSAAACGLQTRYDFHVLPGCGHSFRECMGAGRMGWSVFDFLLGCRSLLDGVRRSSSEG